MRPEAERLKIWREQPIRFIKECLNHEPDAWQADVLDAFGNPKIKKISMQACKGPGKTFIEAVCIWNFALTRDCPNIACISYSGDQLRSGLWKELYRLQQRSEILKNCFKWSSERIVFKDRPGDWWIDARQFAKTADKQAQSSALAGLHSPYMLVVIDEAGDVPDAVAITAEAALSTGIETRMVISGNPTRRSGPLWRAATKERDDTGEKGWKVFEITGDPDDPKRAPKVDIDWARNLIESHGKDSPWVLVNVFGKFPQTAFDSLIGDEEVAAAQNRGFRGHEYDFSQKRIGCDVGRFGDDRTVIIARQGLMAGWEPVIMRPESGLEAWSQRVGERIIRGKIAFGSEVEFVDGVGVGAGVVDALRAAGYSPMDINFGARASNPEKYANKGTECWARMADWLKSGGCIPKDPQLAKELTARKFSFTPGKQQMMLEPKSIMKEREGWSPDIADALALTFALPEAERSNIERSRGMNEVLEMAYKPKEWDPWG